VNPYEQPDIDMLLWDLYDLAVEDPGSLCSTRLSERLLVSMRVEGSTITTTLSVTLDAPPQPSGSIGRPAASR
jgi:hypothetical protein